MENGKTLGRSSVGLLIVAVLLTCGIYVLIWFFERRKDLEQLQTPTRLTKQMVVMLVVLWIAGIVLVIAGGWAGHSVVATLGNLCNLADTVLLIVLAFKIRRILDEYYNQRLKRGVTISAVLTFFFTIFYLQYIMNRLPAADGPETNSLSKK